MPALFPWCLPYVPPSLPETHPIMARKRRIFAQAIHARSMRVRRRRG